MGATTNGQAPAAGKGGQAPAPQGQQQQQPAAQFDRYQAARMPAQPITNAPPGVRPQQPAPQQPPGQFGKGGGNMPPMGANDQAWLGGWQQNPNPWAQGGNWAGGSQYAPSGWGKGGAPMPQPGGPGQNGHMGPGAGEAPPAAPAQGGGWMSWNPAAQAALNGPQQFGSIVNDQFKQSLTADDATRLLSSTTNQAEDYALHKAFRENGFGSNHPAYVAVLDGLRKKYGDQFRNVINYYDQDSGTPHNNVQFDWKTGDFVFDPRWDWNKMNFNQHASAAYNPAYAGWEGNQADILQRRKAFG